MREKGDSPHRTNPDLLVVGIAARQHGVATHRQLVDAGVSSSGISRRVQKGWLDRVHQGVYAVGNSRLSYEGRCMAAVLAYGKGAAVSHRSAAALWKLLPVGAGAIDISIAGGRKRRRHGIRAHRGASLDRNLLTRRNGIPLTTPAATVADLRPVVSEQELRQAIRQADALGLPLGLEVEPDRTRSELEFLFLELCRRNCLPEPEVNVRIGSAIVDFLWRGRRLIVETDGYRYHRGRHAFEGDRTRDLDLRALGYDVIRLTHRQVVDQPEQVARVLEMALRGD